jgi:hypothetical protein
MRKMVLIDGIIFSSLLKEIVLIDGLVGMIIVMMEHLTIDVMTAMKMSISLTRVYQQNNMLILQEEYLETEILHNSIEFFMHDSKYDKCCKYKGADFC